MNKNVCIKISLKFIPKVQINNIPTMVQIMVRRPSGDQPLSEPVMVSIYSPNHCFVRILPKHITAHIANAPNYCQYISINSIQTSTLTAARYTTIAVLQHRSNVNLINATPFSKISSHIKKNQTTFWNHMETAAFWFQFYQTVKLTTMQYIYIYMCVCVFVCVCYSTSMS